MNSPPTFQLRFGDWADLHTDAKAVRFEVFVKEQHVPTEIELDDMDAVCLHAVAYDASQNVLGTGRLLPDGHIGRMAVRKIARGGGVGGAILQALMSAAQQRGDKQVMLNAQIHAEAFYARHGFARHGAEFFEAGIAHIEMRHPFATVEKLL